MLNIHGLLSYSDSLNILYVEDDESLRNNMHSLLDSLFKHIDMAENGRVGLELYKTNNYDIVITDINMPEMDGLTLIEEIHKIRPEQKVVVISAYNESDMLITMIKKGVHGFILKPVLQKDLLVSLYSVCRDAHMQVANSQLINELQETNLKLKKQNRDLLSLVNTISVKNRQIEQLINPSSSSCLSKSSNSNLLNEYFAKDADEGELNILLAKEDCDDLLELFTEIPEIISASMSEPEKDVFTDAIVNNIRRAENIFIRYTPYVDIIASSLGELAATIQDNRLEVNTLLSNNVDALLMYFDAISHDIERFVERFRLESLAMKNSHHIHTPTALSIKQVVEMINPNSIECGDVDFFI